MYRFIPLPNQEEPEAVQPPKRNWRDSAVLSAVCWFIFVGAFIAGMVYVSIGLVILLAVTRTLGPVCGRKYAVQQERRAIKRERQRQWERNNQ